MVTALNFRDIRIVFMGTPGFAVASLEKLVNAGCNIVGVITAPDKPAGRGMQLQYSAVKKYALEKNLKIFQPEKLKNPSFLEDLKSLKADIQIVVAFRMLPEIVWDMPPMGTINVHASLLPDYRGAAPINWAIINGETETGITTFKLQHEIDTGNILMQEKIAIDENETAGGLHDKLKILGAGVLLKTIEGLAKNNLTEIPQAETPFVGGINTSGVTGIKHAPKIYTDSCRINWNRNAGTVYNLIRGLSPSPGAFTFLNDKMLKIFFGKKEMINHQVQIGDVETDGKTFLKFACTDGYIHCTEVQLQGKKRMQIEEFLRGYTFR